MCFSLRIFKLNVFFYDERFCYSEVVCKVLLWVFFELNENVISLELCSFFVFRLFAIFLLYEEFFVLERLILIDSYYGIILW